LASKLLIHEPYLVIGNGSDVRQNYLYKTISALGLECAYLAGSPTLSKAAGCVFLPMTQTASPKDVMMVRPGGTLACGKASVDALAAAQDRYVRVIPLLEDEPFTQENADMTAEAAVGLLITASPYRLSEMKIAIVGGGRIARALAMRLIALKAGHVEAFARSSEQRAKAEALGAQSSALPVGERLAGFHALFNTAPAPVISDDELGYLAEGAYACELASSPGFSLEAAEGLGLTAVKASGLPGRYTPASAAALIWRCVKNNLEDEQ